MVRVILASKPIKRATAMIIVSMTSFIIVLIILMIMVAPPRDIRVPLFAVAFAGLIDALALYYIKRISRIYRMVMGLKNSIMVRGNKLILNREYTGELGILRLRAYWRSSGRGSSTYHVIQKFDPEKILHIREVDLDELGKRGYTIILNPDGSGYVSMPCIRFLDYDARDTYVCVMHPDYSRLSGGRITLTVSYENTDLSSASVELSKRVIRGTISRVMAGKSRSTKLELVGSIDKPYKAYATEEIIVAREPIKQFEHIIEPSEPIIIVTHKLLASPLQIKNAVVRDVARRLKGLISGFSEGTYKLRLVLDLPLRRDVYTEQPIKTEKEG